MDEYDQEDHLVLDTPPEFQFLIVVGNEAKAQVFGPREKRNWVMWKLSQYVIALMREGPVSVKRLINGEWKDCDDWRKLAH